MKKHIWKKTIGFVLIGIFIASVFTITDTYSSFQKNNDGYGNVASADSEDIISYMEIYYDNGVPILKLEQGDDMDYSPIVFFSIEGDAKDYALHMNSVKLDGTVEIPIIPNVNLPQALSLIISPKSEITGILKIKHLNEFIDEALDISLSREYLLSRYFSHRGLEEYSKDYLSYKERAQLIDLIKDSLLYTERYLEWEGVNWEEDYNWISEANISSEQVALIDIIAPNLLEYNERLYGVFEVVLEDLMVEIEKNNALTRENAELLSKIEELSLESEELRGEINSLYGHISTLEAQISELINKLNDQPAPDSGNSNETEEESLGQP